MELDELVRVLGGKRRGAFVGLTYVSDEKGYSKEVSMVVRQGVDYGKLAVVIAERLKKELEGASKIERALWYEHTEHRSVLRSLKDTSKHYFQAFQPRNVRVKYFIGSDEVSKEVVESMGLLKPSKGEKPLCLTIGVDKIVSIR